MIHVISQWVFLLMSTLKYYDSITPATASQLSNPTGIFAKGWYAGPLLEAMPGLTWIYYTLLCKQILQMS